MNTPSIEEILALIDAGLPPGYGYPSRRKRHRMNMRQLKKLHLPPHTCVCAEAYLKLSRPLTRNDCTSLELFPDCSEHSQCFLQLMVNVAESTGCGIVTNTPAFNEAHECSVESMNAKTARQDLEDIIRFAETLIKHPAICEVRLDLEEGWHCNKDGEAFVYTSLIFRKNETAH